MRKNKPRYKFQFTCHGKQVLLGIGEKHTEEGNPLCIVNGWNPAEGLLYIETFGKKLVLNKKNNEFKMFRLAYTTDGKRERQLKNLSKA